MFPDNIGIGAPNFLPNFFTKEVPLAAMLPYVSLVDDKTIRTRGDEFFQCMEVTGINSATAEDEYISKVSASLAHFVASKRHFFTYYIHKISRRAEITLKATNSDDFASSVDAKWQKHVGTMGANDTAIIVTIIKRRSIGRKLAFFKKLNESADKEFIDGEIELLNEVCANFKTVFAYMKPKKLSAKTGELLGFLGSINTGVMKPIKPTHAIGLISENIANVNVDFDQDIFRLSGGNQPTKFGTTLAVKTYGDTAYPSMFDELELPIDMVVTQSFKPASKAIMLERIRQKKRFRINVSDAAKLAVQELREAEEALEADQVTYGEHHMTVTVFSDEPQKLRGIVAEIKSIADEKGIILMSEAAGANIHFLSQHPANDHLRLRADFLTNWNFAHFAAMHKTPLGKAGHEVPWATPITVFPTQLGTPYQFNFHEKGSQVGEPTGGHTLILGRPGAGKSVIAAFLAAQARRVDARVIALDYRQGLEMSVRALGGSYSVVRAGEKTGLNPLSVETDKDGIAWLTDWLSILLSESGKPLSPRQTKIIANAARQNAKADPKLQVWDQFATLLKAGGEGTDLFDRFNEWTKDGRYGWIFGESTNDTLSLEGDCIGYDLTGVLDSENERERMAVLSYLFRRIERLISDKRKTILLIDEAAVALDNPYFAAKLDKLCVTARKQHCVLMFLTQYASQLENKAGETIIRSTSTKLLLPNIDAKASDYDALKLGEKSLETILSFNSETRLGLLIDDGGSVVVDTDLSVLGNGLTIFGGLKAGERLVGENYRDNPQFWKEYLND